METPLSVKNISSSSLLGFHDFDLAEEAARYAELDRAAERMANRLASFK